MAAAVDAVTQSEPRAMPEKSLPEKQALRVHYIDPAPSAVESVRGSINMNFLWGWEEEAGCPTLSGTREGLSVG